MRKKWLKGVPCLIKSKIVKKMGMKIGSLMCKTLLSLSKVSYISARRLIKKRRMKKKVRNKLRFH